MKGYEWGKGTVKCGFCGLHGHNRTSCSAVPVIYERYCTNANQAAQNNKQYNPTRVEKMAIKEMFRRKNKPSVTKKRRKARCSFCNSLKHKRNRCPKFTKFKAKVKKANSNWRRRFVSEANSHGFGIGSLVSLPLGLLETHYPKPDSSTVGIIAGFDKNKLNVFCSYDKGGLYSTVPAVDIFTEGKMIKVTVPRLRGNWSKDLIPNRSSWQFYEVLSTKADSGEPPDGWYEAMKWFFANISTKSRDYPMLMELIQKWTKNVLPR